MNATSIRNAGSLPPPKMWVSYPGMKRKRFIRVPAVILGRGRPILWALLGEVSERSKERDWKSRGCRKVPRGFKSLPLRYRDVAILRRDVPVAIAIRRAGGRASHREGDEPGQGLLRDARRDEARSRPVLPQRRRRDRACALRAADAAEAPSRRGRGRGDLPEARAEAPSRLDRDRDRHVSLGPHPRRLSRARPRAGRRGRAPPRS